MVSEPLDIDDFETKDGNFLESNKRLLIVIGIIAIVLITVLLVFRILGNGEDGFNIVIDEVNVSENTVTVFNLGDSTLEEGDLLITSNGVEVGSNEVRLPPDEGMSIVVDDLKYGDEFIARTPQGEDSYTVTEENGDENGDNGDEDDNETVMETDIDLVNIDQDVYQGQTFELEVLITGESNLSEEVEFLFDTEVVESRNVTLEDGEEEIRFEYDTSNVEVGNYFVEVRIDDKDVNLLRSVDVLEEIPEHFEVDIVDFSDPVYIGETFSMIYNVTNRFENNETQEIEIHNNGTLVNNDTIELNASESYQGVFSWDTGPEDSGNYTLNVSSEDHYDIIEYEVFSRETSLDLLYFNSTLFASELFEFSAELNNYNETDKNMSTNFTIFEGQNIVYSDSYNITVNGSSSKALNHSWSTGTRDYGNYIVNLTVGNNSIQREFNVHSIDEELIEVDIVGDYFELFEEESESIVVYVKNTGNQTNIQNIDFEIIDEQDNIVYNDAKEVEIPPGIDEESLERIDFTWNPVKNDAGNYTIEVSSDYDNDEAEIKVKDAHIFDLSLFEVNDAIVRGETMKPNVTVENIGPKSGSQTLRAMLDDDIMDQYTLDLEPNEHNISNFAWGTSDIEPGHYTLNVTSEDYYDYTGIMIYEYGFHVNITEKKLTTYRGEDVTIEANITNYGDEIESQWISFSVTGPEFSDYIGEARVENLAPGESTIVERTWEQTNVRPNVYDFEVSSYDHNSSGEITVEDESFIIDDFEEYEVNRFPFDNWVRASDPGPTGRLEVVSDNTLMGDRAFYGSGASEPGDDSKAIAERYTDEITPKRVSFMYRNDRRGYNPHDYRDYNRIWFGSMFDNIFGVEVATIGDSDEVYVMPNALDEHKKEVGYTEEWFRFNIKNIEWEDDTYDLEVVYVGDGGVEHRATWEELDFVNNADNINRIELVFDYLSEEGAMVDEFRYSIA